MTSQALEPTTSGPAVPQPGRLGQGTAVEQSRAVAEVQGAIYTAQMFPRDVQAAVRAMRETCAQIAMAERAFYRFPRAGTTVSGPSVYLARALATCWGNIQHGVTELRRDDEYGQSEMMAWAWDVQTNARVSLTFIVPHKRDKRGGPERLVDMRDIYEKNANDGARRVREAIFGVLPPWFVEQAKELCSQTLRNGGGKPLATRVADAITGFEGLGVAVDQLETKLGRVSGKWTEHDVAQLGVIFKSVQRGEIALEEEFPPPRIKAADILAEAGGAPTTPPAPPAEAPPATYGPAGDDWPEVAKPGSGSGRKRSASS